MFAFWIRHSKIFFIIAPYTKDRAAVAIRILRIHSSRAGRASLRVGLAQHNRQISEFREGPQSRIPRDILSFFAIPIRTCPSPSPDALWHGSNEIEWRAG